MTDTAALAHEVEATLENALETIADPSLAAAAQETFVSAEEAVRRLRDALTHAAAELRAEAARREGGGGHAAEAGEVAAQLRQLADRLEEPVAWQCVDRIVHELVSDLLVAAVATARHGASATLAARAAAVGVLAASDTLWSGGSARLGCAYGYDALLALVRTTARAH